MGASEEQIPREEAYIYANKIIQVGGGPSKKGQNSVFWNP